jgi:ABC-type polysaccharide/polyol phosphate transport system ATPase subunit
MSNDNEILVKVDSVSKKFCRDLKKSLWYGMCDVASELLPFSSNKEPGTKNQEHSPSLRDGEFWANKDISFELRRGECVGLIGHNGAGKTTLLKMLNGLIKPDEGTIEMRGRVGALIALGAGFNPILTGRENIYVNGSVLGLTKREIDENVEKIIDFAEIRDFIDTPVQSYSSGMQVRLGFAVASSLKPDILILDEVLAVGDMAFQAKCFNRLAELREQGTAFILVSHQLHHISRSCSTVLLLNGGKIEHYGDVSRGLEIYSDAMHRRISNESDTGDSYLGQVGSLEVEFEDVYFTNESGEKVDEIKTNGELCVKIPYKCLVDSILNPVLELALKDPSGEMIFHGSSRISGKDLGELRGRGMLTISFPKMPASNLTLTAAIVLWDSKMQKLICWQRGKTILVKGDPLCVGKFEIANNWSHRNGP